MSTKLTDLDIYEIISSYESGHSIRNIEKNCKVKRTRIGNILKEYGIERKSTGNPYRLRKYKLNEKYFEQIDSEQKAYWLGFIIADGYVGDDGLIINLSIKDEDHLKLFLQHIESDTKITYQNKTKSCKIAMYSYDLVISLRKFGLSKSKFKDASFPKIPKRLILHLIRGLIDGDGSISVSKNTYKKGILPVYSVKISGTRNVVENIIKHISRKCKTTSSLIKEHTSGFCESGWGGNRNVLNILNYIYKDSTVYLKRKFDRYQYLKNNYDHSRYRSQANID